MCITKVFDGPGPRGIVGCVLLELSVQHRDEDGLKEFSLGLDGGVSYSLENAPPVSLELGPLVNHVHDMLRALERRPRERGRGREGRGRGGGNET